MLLPRYPFSPREFSRDTAPYDQLPPTGKSIVCKIAGNIYPTKTSSANHCQLHEATSPRTKLKAAIRKGKQGYTGNC